MTSSYEAMRDAIAEIKALTDKPLMDSPDEIVVAVRDIIRVLSLEETGTDMDDVEEFIAESPSHDDFGSRAQDHADRYGEGYEVEHGLGEDPRSWAWMEGMEPSAEEEDDDA